MAEIVPFRGITYDLSLVGGLASAVSPPYDVISAAEQKALYNAGPYNFVRVILNRAESEDDEDCTYHRAAGYLQTWLSEGVLREDREEALYHYRQEFTNPADGRRYSRDGIFCALRLEPYSCGIVLPHEETRMKAKSDRLALMRATVSNPEPIYALYEDPAQHTSALFSSAVLSAPDLSVTIDADLHEVRRIIDVDTIGSFQRYLSDRRIWIADGHHRYETALAYRDGQPEGSRNPAAEYVLTVLSAFEDPGLVVLPTHRLIRNLPDSRIEQLIVRIERYFDVSPSTTSDLMRRLTGAGGAKHVFGLVLRDESYLLELRDERTMDEAVLNHSPDWKRLDVSILQTLVLERALEIPASALATTPDVGYTRDWNEAFAAVTSGAYQAALLLAQPSADEVKRVAAAGEKMPPKSTFFYPKLWSGLVLRSLKQGSV